MIEEKVSQLLREYAISKSQYYERLEPILFPILDNFLCVVIFHDVNPNVVEHWLNRAKQLPRSLFYVKVKTNVENAINKAFEDDFGTEYEDIDVRHYHENIEYYASKPKEEKMLARLNAEEYFSKYNNLIISTIDTLKQSLLKEDRVMWDKAVDDFWRTVSSEE